MKALCIAMGKTRFNDKEKNAEYCQLCMENLTRSTLNWFSRFEPNSTEKITKLYTVFMKYYFIFIEKENRIPTYGQCPRRERNTSVHSSGGLIMSPLASLCMINQV